MAALFSGPEYASYRSLMRGLKLVRGTVTNALVEVEGWQEGDWYLLDDAPYLFSAADEDEWPRRRYEEFAAAIWLPRLDQWLAMLGEAVAATYARSAQTVPPWPGFARTQALSMLQVRADRFPNEPLEEAAARLWVAVTGAGQTSTAD